MMMVMVGKVIRTKSEHSSLFYLIVSKAGFLKPKDVTKKCGVVRKKRMDYFG